MITHCYFWKHHDSFCHADGNVTHSRSTCGTDDYTLSGESELGGKAYVTVLQTLSIYLLDDRKFRFERSNGRRTTSSTCGL